MVLAGIQTVTGAKTFNAGKCLVATATQGDNSTNAASTAYVDTGLATKVTALATVALTGANTLTQASHSNRPLTWTGSSTAAQALPTTQTAGDIIDLMNDGSAPVTFTNCISTNGYKNSCLPSEHFYAESDGTSWYSVTPRVNSTVITLTDGATITWDTDISGAAQVTLGGNRTLVMNNTQAGGVYILWVAQDGTGSRTLAQPAIVKKAAADSLSLSTAASALDCVTYAHNGGIMMARAALNIG
jgi:hypothetical protein